jgi:hypothetical protein
MKVRLLKTLMGEYGGNKGDVIDAPNYVANRYIQVGYAERYKPCNCDDCKDGEPCSEEEEIAAIETVEVVETATAEPKKRRKPRVKKN